MVDRLSPEAEARRLHAIRQAEESGQPIAAAARALGDITPDTLRAWYNGYRVRGPAPEAPPPIIAPPASSVIVEQTTRELRDAAFWKRRALEAERRADDLEHLAEELAGVRSIAVDVPPWHETPSAPHASRSILIAHTSDLHMGEVIDPREVGGLNAFNPEIAATRMRRYFDAVCEKGAEWMGGRTCDGVLLTMGGDLVSGDIHEELMRTNALTSHEQVAQVVGVYDAGIRQLAARFGKVHVVAVPGNHGRTTVKQTFKLASRLSYDILAATMLRDRFKGDSAVTWQIAEGIDVRVPIYGKTILVTHGHMIGTAGGNGFAGPVLPIVRGGHKIKAQSAAAGLGCDLILMGHYHTSAAPPSILANGSVPGYSEYGQGLRVALEPPKQWLARFSSTWGLADMLAVQLEERQTRWREKAA